jgi:hypothetical protein
VQSDNHRALASNPNRLAQITLQNRTASVDEEIDAVIGERDAMIFIFSSTYIHLEELDICYVLPGCEFSGEFQITGLTLNPNNCAAARGEVDCELTMSTAEIQHITVRLKMLLDKCKERIFAIACCDGRLPAMSESPRRDPWISQPAIHVERSGIFWHSHLYFLAISSLSKSTPL